jgi:hypothetical protein
MLLCLECNSELNHSFCLAVAEIHIFRWGRAKPPKFQWRNYYGLRPGEPGGPQPQWAKWGPPALGDRAKTLARASDMLQCRFLTIKIL